MLGLAIAQDLYDRFPDSQEGRLAKLRAHVVSRQSCAVVGKRLELGKRLLEQGGNEGDPEELRRLAVNRNVLAALVEACLGALYLEHGFEPIRAPIVSAFADRIEYALQGHVDFKTELQEELARRGKTVSYSVLEVEGPPHDRTVHLRRRDRRGAGRCRHRRVEKGGRAGRRASGPREVLGRLETEALDLVAPPDEHLGHELGRKEPVLHDSRGRRQGLGAGARVADRPEVVGDDAAVGTSWHVAKLDLSEPRERRVEPVGKELEWNRRRDRLDELVGGGDDDEAVG